MSLEELEIQKHTKPIEKELNHQKEKNANLKKAAIMLANALWRYQSYNKQSNGAERSLYDESLIALDAYKATKNPRPRRR